MKQNVQQKVVGKSFLYHTQSVMFRFDKRNTWFEVSVQCVRGFSANSRGMWQSYKDLHKAEHLRSMKIMKSQVVSAPLKSVFKLLPSHCKHNTMSAVRVMIPFQTIYWLLRSRVMVVLVWCWSLLYGPTCSLWNPLEQGCALLLCPVAPGQVEFLVKPEKCRETTPLRPPAGLLNVVLILRFTFNYSVRTDFIFSWMLVLWQGSTVCVSVSNTSFVWTDDKITWKTSSKS